jgi:hypothetical protein
LESRTAGGSSLPRAWKGRPDRTWASPPVHRLARDESLVGVLPWPPLQSELPRGGRSRSIGALEEDDTVLELVIGGREHGRDKRAAAGGAA